MAWLSITTNTKILSRWDILEQHSEILRTKLLDSNQTPVYIKTVYVCGFEDFEKIQSVLNNLKGHHIGKVIFDEKYPDEQTQASTSDHMVVSVFEMLTPFFSQNTIDRIELNTITITVELLRSLFVITNTYDIKTVVFDYVNFSDIDADFDHTSNVIGLPINANNLGLQNRGCIHLKLRYQRHHPNPMLLNIIGYYLLCYDRLEKLSVRCSDDERAFDVCWNSFWKLVGNGSLRELSLKNTFSGVSIPKSQFAELSSSLIDCQTLKAISFSGEPDASEFFRNSCIDASFHIETLKYVDCTVGTECWNDIAKFIVSQPTLKKLHLANTNLQKLNFFILHEFFEFSNLEEISIKHCGMHGEHLEMFGFALSKCRFIRYFNMKRNSLKDVNICSFRAFFENNKFESLNLARCEIGYDFVAMLCEVFSGSYVRELNLSGNEIFGEPSTIATLKNFLTRNDVEKLNLKRCGIEKDGFVDLCEQLADCKSLRSLTLDDNDLSGLTLTDVDKFPCCVEQYGFYNCKIDPDVLFYLLGTKPINFLFVDETMQDWLTPRIRAVKNGESELFRPENISVTIYQQYCW